MRSVKFVMMTKRERYIAIVSLVACRRPSSTTATRQLHGRPQARLTMPEKPESSIVDDGRTCMMMTERSRCQEATSLNACLDSWSPATSRQRASDGQRHQQTRAASESIINASLDMV